MGEYTDIVEIDAPSSAFAGESVPVTIKIKNTWDSTLLIAADGAYDGIPFLHMDYWIPAGETHSFSGSFIMPDTGVTIRARSSYWVFGDIWELDDELSRDVEAAVPPEGRITGKWVNKAPEGFRLGIPAAVAADGNTFEVGVKYKNLGKSVIAGCEVKVWDPDGTLRASPAIDWTGMSTNEELSKEYNICRVDKPGPWTTVIRFLAQD